LLTTTTTTTTTTQQIATNMQLTIAPESSASLAADKTTRCLLTTRYPLLSRQSSAAFALADQLVEELTRAVPAQLGPPPAVPSPPTTAEDGGASSTDNTADTRLHAILLQRNRLLVRFDLFLHDCKPKVRRQVDESMAQPMHILVKSGDVCQMRRSPMLDGQVAERYAHFREVDKGPRPYFADSLNPPLYVNGRRFEGRLEDVDSDFEFPSDEDDDDETWDAQEVCGDRIADDGVAELRVRWKSGRETWEMYDDVAKTLPEVLAEYKRRGGQAS
jgi:hypothetical protein